MPKVFVDILKTFSTQKIQVSYNNIVCNSVEHVEFCAWKLRFADSIDFLLPFEGRNKTSLDLRNPTMGNSK